MKIAPFRALLYVLAVLTAFGTSGWSQNPGANVNIINPAPGSFAGDVFERQVETDIAASPVNSSRAMAGFITYQTLAPGASSWCGYSETTNGGKTWSSNLIPGFPQDTSPQGTSSPLRTLGLQQCSDPALAAAPPNATDPAQIYYGALGLTQGSLTTAFVATMRDLDDGNGHFQYVRTVVTDSGNPSFNGQVMDKPSIAYDPPSAGFPQGIVHFTWVDFTGTAKSTKFQSKVMYSRSTDGGRTFSTPVKLNGTFGQNQGTAIARTANGTIYVIWRTFNTENGMQVVTIGRNGGISTPTTIAGGANFFPYDQPTLPDAGSPNFAAFRANAFPTATADRNGRVIVVWPEYINPINGLPASPGTGPSPLAIPKIVITSSPDGLAWDSRSAAVPLSPLNAVQVQPVLKAGGGLVSLFYYDSSNDTHPQALNYVPEYKQWVYTGSGVGADSGMDRRMEVFVAQASLNSAGSAYIPQDAGGTPIFGAPVQVSQYATSTGFDSNGNPLPGGVQPGQIVPRTLGFPDVAINLPNLKTTSSGTIPFIGDYPGMVPAVEYIPLGGGSWRLALDPGDYQARTFYTVWTDTRGVQFPGFPAPSMNGNWAGPYSIASCLNPGVRNTKIFFAPISPGVIARWSGTARPLQLSGAPIQAQFTVTVENVTSTDRYFHVSIVPSAEVWSFVQTGTPQPDNYLQILQTSSASMGVYFQGPSATPSLPVVITVQEVDVNGVTLAGGLTTSLAFSPSGSAIQLGSSTVQALGVSPQVVNPFSNLQPGLIPQPSDPTIQNFNFKTFNFKTFAPTTDVTWPVSGLGLLPTSGNAFVNVAGVQDALNSGYEFNLFVYVTQSTPALAGCTVGQLNQDQIISNIPIISTGSTQLVTDFNFKTFNFKTFNFKTFPPPDITNATFVADQSGVKVTLRSNSPSSLYNPTPTNGVASGAVVAQALNPGATAPSASFNDTTPPVITPIITGTQGTNGWYRSAVTVTWNVSDPGSGIGSQTSCDPFTQTADTPGTTLSCSAVNGAGLPNSASVTIKIDTTPPTVTASISPKPSGTGWYNIATGRPTVSFTCTDTGSGVTNCPASIVVADGANQTISSGIVTDQAGNQATSVSISGINVDLTPPTITAAISPGSPAATGWYNAATGRPTISFTCVDNLSGLAATCPLAIALGDGANQTVSRSVMDKAGNTGTATITGINVDAVPPSIIMTAPANNGTYVLNAPVAANYSCFDALSGLAACQAPVNSGANFSTSSVSPNPQPFTVTASDQAGNFTNLTDSYFVMYNFILTPPKSPANLGSAVPLIWQLQDANGAIITDMSSLVAITSVFNNAQPVSGPCVASQSGTSPAILYSPATGATGGSNFRFVSPNFQLNWDSSTANATGRGCYTIEFQLKDDSVGSPNFTVLDPSRLHLASVQLK